MTIQEPLTLQDRTNYSKGYLPVAPLLEFFTARMKRWQQQNGNSNAVGIEHGGTIKEFCTVHGMHDKQYYRLIHVTWVSPIVIDRVCCRLGVHPIDVYGNDWTNDERLFE